MARSRPAGILLASLLLSLILVAPAAAVSIVSENQTVAYSGTTSHIDLNAYDPGRAAISEVEFIVNPDTQVDFTFYAYNQEITGEINRTTTGPKTELITYRIGDTISGPHESGTLLGLFDLEPHKFTIVNHASSTDTFPPLSLWLRNHNKGIGWEDPMGEIPDVAYRLQATATKDVDITVTTAPIDDIHGQISKIWDLGNEGPIQFITVLRGLFEGVYLVVSLGWYIFKTVFIDNFLLFFGLFEAVGLAYAANKSRDIFQFYKKIVYYNAAVFRAMVWLIEKMVTILTRIIEAINPIG